MRLRWGSLLVLAAGLEALACLLIVAPAYAAVVGEWRVNLLKGTTTQATVTGATQDAAWSACQARIPRSAAASTYTCQTPRYVASVTLDPTPSPTPTPTPTPVPTPTPTPTPVPTAGTYTDLASAPACAKVTVYSGVARIIVDASAAGIPIHQGNCYFATPATAAAVWASAKPGDVVYLRAGTYTKIESTYCAECALGTFKQGTAAQPIALVAAPGEAVTIQNSGHAPVFLGDGNSKARYLTIAGVTIIGESSAISGGGDTGASSTRPETGADYIRVVGNTLKITQTVYNTMTGILNLQGDGWKVLGNTFVDLPRPIYNNNHAIYVQNGADDVEIAYNRLVDLHMGFSIQVHQDYYHQYDNVRIHDNLLKGASASDMRGVGLGHLLDASTVFLFSNRYENLGQTDWGCITLYRGVIDIRNEQCIGTRGGLLLNGQAGGVRRVTADGNCWPGVVTQNGASLSELVLTNPRACP